MSLSRLLPLAAALLVAGCAAQTDSPDASLAPAGGAPSAPAGPASVAAIAPAASGYKLTAAEEKLDCPKLTGQMKVRIANMRATFDRRTGSDTSRAAQSVVTPVFGGPKRGADPEADLALDRAKLEAFTRRLADKKCKALDIDAELKGEAAPAAPAKAVPKKAG